MANSEEFRIQSEADLEIVILHESHSLLANIISSHLYQVHGTPPDQNVMFHNENSFILFLVWTWELFAEGPGNVYINDNNMNMSLIKGVKWLCDKCSQEANAHGLLEAHNNLAVWLNEKPEFEFWCGEHSQMLKFNLSNNQLLSFAANESKHSIIRLGRKLKQLHKYCIDAGFQCSIQDTIPILDDFIIEARSRLQYHSTWMVELLGNYFLAINNLIIDRWSKNPTNRTSEIDVPTGVSSDVFINLYGRTLIFKRYKERRITELTPSTSEFLKKRYRENCTGGYK